MFNIMFKLILFCAYCALSNGFEVKFKSLTNQITVEFTKFENVTDRDYWYEEIVVGPYGKDDTQIDIIQNLSALRYITMQKIGQMEVPVFRDLKNIRTVNLARNDIEYINNTVFSETSLANIFLNQNRIKNVEPDTFGMEIIWVNLACNQLTDVSSNWFRNSGHLKRLHLGGNQIQHIPQDAFADFYSLIDINFAYNQLKTIGPKAFSGNFRYESVVLLHNNLTHLDASVFHPTSTTIDRFNIAFNQLHYLSTHLMDIVEIGNANIEGNPWICPCYGQVKKWSHSKDGYECFNSTVDSEVHCVDDEFSEIILSENEPPYKNGEEYCVDDFDIYL